MKPMESVASPTLHTANGNDSSYWREIAGLENVTEMTASISRKTTIMDVFQPK
jgi:hypothetical protein